MLRQLPLRNAVGRWANVSLPGGFRWDAQITPLEGPHMTNVKSQWCCPEPSTDMEEPVAENVVPRQAAAVGRPDVKSGRLWIKVCHFGLRETLASVSTM